MKKLTRVTEYDFIDAVNYDPISGALTWKERTPDMYRERVPEKGEEWAIGAARRFNFLFAGKPVGTDAMLRSDLRRVRLSFRPREEVKRTMQLVSWLAATGEKPAPGLKVMSIDGDPFNLKANNIAAASPVARMVVRDPLHGITKLGDKYGWRHYLSGKWISCGSVRFDSAKEAADHRLATMRKMGLYTFIRLDEVARG